MSKEGDGMRKLYTRAFKEFFFRHLTATRSRLHCTQAEMAEKLAMDERSYADLDRGLSCCSALTLALYLIYCCEDPLAFLHQLHSALEQERDHAA